MFQDGTGLAEYVVWKFGDEENLPKAAKTCSQYYVFLGESRSINNGKLRFYCIFLYTFS